jgi:hypothetical protein
MRSIEMPNATSAARAVTIGIATINRRVRFRRSLLTS